jgi:hypothetical protein
VTEIVAFTTIKISKTTDEDSWELFVEAFAKDSLVVEHHAAKWLCTGRMQWVPMPSLALGWGFSELDHRTWKCPAGGWKVWDPRISNLEAGLAAGDLVFNARVTGEVLKLCSQLDGIQFTIFQEGSFPAHLLQNNIVHGESDFDLKNP